MKKALRDPKDATNFFLLYANQTPGDILLRDDLDAWAAAYPSRVKIWYTVDRLNEKQAPADWPFSLGFINDEMLAQHMPKPGPGVFVGKRLRPHTLVAYGLIH
jgi:nitrate reductase (NAD(P)H)